MMIWRRFLLDEIWRCSCSMSENKKKLGPLDRCNDIPSPLLLALDGIVVMHALVASRHE